MDMTALMEAEIRAALAEATVDALQESQAEGAAIDQAVLSASAQIDSQFIGGTAGGATVVAGAMSASVEISGSAVGQAVSGWYKVSGNNRRIIEDDEIAAIMASIMPSVMNHRKIGQRAFFCSSSRVRSPFFPVTN